MLSVNNDHVLLASIPVRNAGSGPGHAELCTLLQDKRSRDCIHNVDIAEGAGQIARGQVLVLSIRISAVQAPISGYLGCSRMTEQANW